MASFGEGKIVTKVYGKMDAFLVEVRSIGGLSGSPVVVQFGVIRVVKGQTKIAKEPIVYLLGLIHGHYDEQVNSIDEADANGISPERVNTGIAIVVPFQRINDTICAFERRAA